MYIVYSHTCFWREKFTNTFPLVIERIKCKYTLFTRYIDDLLLKGNHPLFSSYKGFSYVFGIISGCNDYEEC